jgi:type I restriction enzyme M protein
MITGELKASVDRIWDAFWSGGIANPLEVMEQITYLLFIRRLDDLQTAKENRANRLGVPIEAPIFPVGTDETGQPYADLRWSRFKDRGPGEMFGIVSERVFPFLRQIGGDDSTYSHHMRDARFTIPTPALLAKVVDMLDGLPMEGRDTEGDVYEYMLSKIASAGAERPVPHTEAHHRADGGHDSAIADGRDLRSGVRYRRFPDRRRRAPAKHSSWCRGRRGVA